MNLRAATLEDLDLLQLWDSLANTEERGADGPWPWDDMLTSDADWQQLFIAEVNGRPIGFLQILDPQREETHYWGEVPAGLRAIDLWIGEVADQGRGYGSEMMRQAIHKCFESPEVTAILVDPLESNPRAHRFYERLGFGLVGPRVFGDDACLVYRLERSRWEQALAG